MRITFLFIAKDIKEAPDISKIKTIHSRLTETSKRPEGNLNEVKVIPKLSM